MKLKILLTTILIASINTPAFAADVESASCVVTAQVEKIESQMKISDTDTSKIEEVIKFATLGVIDVRAKDSTKDCGFIAPAMDFKASVSDPKFLEEGDTIQSGVVLSSTQAADGPVSLILWQPVELVESSTTLPPDFHLNSSAEPEK